MANRTLFAVTIIVHLLATFVFVSWSGSWQAGVLNDASPGTLPVAPTGLLVVAWASTFLQLPIMLPLVFAANELGFNPFDDRIYLLFPVMNSVTVASLVILSRNWRRRYKQRSQGNAV